jgi:hypothetical protein
LRPNNAEAQQGREALLGKLGRGPDGAQAVAQGAAQAVDERPPRDRAGDPAAHSQPPRWTGAYVEGTLLIRGEGTPAEQIRHGSLLPELRARADAIAVEVDPRLVALFARSFPGMRILAANMPQPSAGDISAQAPMSGLAGRLYPNFESFPRHDHGFLAADAARAASLRERLKVDSRVVVGVAWRRDDSLQASEGGVEAGDFKSVLRLPGCRFIDLQSGDTRADRAALARDLPVRMEHLDDVDHTNDIDALAAQMTACDLVVTVSATTAHLAGALGRPTWVFVAPEDAGVWYWRDGREDSLCYPHLRVRQRSPAQSWADLIAASAHEIW